MWFLVICLLITFFFKIMIDQKKSRNFPPGPRGLPIIGNILDIKRLVKKTKFQAHTWCYLAKIYGPVVHLRLGFGYTFIIISGRKAIIEMLSRAEFDGRPDSLEIRLRTGGERRGLIFTDGKIWSEHRRFTIKTLKRLGFDKANMEDMILEDIITLLKIIEELAEKGPITNIYDLVSVTVIASFWFLVTGSKFQLDHEDPKLMEAIAILNENSRSSRITGSIISQLPFLRYIFPRLTGYTQLQERQNRLWLYFKKIITEHQETEIQNEPTNLIDIYLKEMQTQCSSNLSSSSNFNDENLIALIRDLFIASIETTTSTTGFVIAFLSVNQYVQKKIHDELDEVFGKDISPRLAYRNRLPYLQATLAEVGRMGNVGPTSVPHRAMNDTTLLGYDIKKNSILLANLMSVHMDENHWGDPKTFRPERFINEKGEYSESPWLMSFGLGHRRCPGEVLAKNFLFLINACMLQRFHFSIAPEYPEPDLSGIDGFTISPPPINLLIKKRI